MTTTDSDAATATVSDATDPETPTTETPTGPVPDDPPVADPAGRGLRDKATAKAEAAGTAFATWWGFIRQPMSIAETWRLSGQINAQRIPANSPLLAALWWVSNCTDRVLLFALIELLPKFLTGPLRWCVCRPMRRVCLYAVVIILAVVISSLVGG